ncbi:MAG: PIN domain-containing protein [Candidatus Aminicenantes bacterium]|nr:PIN domain-containing protein [Candidatus Aminicenantes bacterium]NIM84471.1 PIN domain-containing protein [Candidatus Aminicenantes bacterium]NIN23992.1 PIN domain-containing protein [Candidatus Aminicenantes bacterium]NIN47706.1 PIN domain-containing protein [Candidatus Aminicenantes bacterium]NIN90636.1 PIN domain-containing protein [Candidatus Aminicenantes bacterium]
MSGRYLLDTNAIINLLKDENASFKFKDKKGVYFVSIITEMELLSFKDITKQDKIKIKKFLPKSCIININKAIKDKTIELRKKKSIKLPDAVICATAMVKNLTLVSDDERLSKIKGLNIVALSDFVD